MLPLQVFASPQPLFPLRRDWLSRRGARTRSATMKNKYEFCSCIASRRDASWVDRNFREIKRSVGTSRANGLAIKVNYEFYRLSPLKTFILKKYFF